MPATVAETCREVFHYTGIGGLTGILESQTLWATHAAFLNDGAEIKAFQARLPEILRPGVARGVDELLTRVPANQTLIDQHGGRSKAIEELTAGISNSMYKVLLGIREGRPISDPYITSFCKSATEDIAQHGLLSQWRGYGQDGGYALVFDTAGLEHLLREEHEKWRYRLFWGDAVYSSESDDKIREELGEDMEQLSAAVAESMQAGWIPEPLEKTYDPLIRCACRYKHWGFHEEREVRIVAMPMNTNIFTKEELSELTEVEKPRQRFVRGGTSIPCIHLFEGITHLPEKPLPMTRIIVGPHREKERRRRAIEILLHKYRLHVPVTVSDIPYAVA